MLLLLLSTCENVSSLRKNGRHRGPGSSPGELRHRVGGNASASTADPLNGLAAPVLVAALGSVLREETLVVVEADGEVTAEVGRLLETAGDVVGTESTETVVGVANRRLGARGGSHLDDESTTLDGMHHDEAGLEHGIRGPRAKESDGTATLLLVIFGVDVEEAGLADAVTRGILGDGADVPNVEAIA